MNLKLVEKINAGFILMGRHVCIQHWPALIKNINSKNRDQKIDIWINNWKMDVNRIKIGKLHNAELESIERFEKKLFILFLEFITYLNTLGSLVKL